MIMGIKYVKGDAVKALQEGQINFLVHGVNCQGVMASGIAKQIRETFPECYGRYIEYTAERKKHNAPVKPGDVQLWIRSGRVIANLYSQDNYGYNGNRYCSYDGIEVGLRHLRDEVLEAQDIVGMPKIGAGLGGGDWNIIQSIILSVFPDRDILVFELDNKTSSQNGDGA